LKRTLLAIAAAVLTSSAFGAPPLADAQRCLADNTTGKERKELIRWIFLGIASHPEISSLATVPADANAQADQFIANLFTRLILEACRTEISLLIKEQGPESIKLAFQTLGQVAMGEIMADPAVSSRMGAFTKLIDEQKFRPLFAPSK